MEIFLFCAAIVIIVAICLFALGFTVGDGDKNERVFKRKLYNDCNICDVHNNNSNNNNSAVGNIYEPIDCGQDLESNSEAEEAIVRLHNIRTRVTQSDYTAIDYAIESIYVRIRVEQILKERGI